MAKIDWEKLRGCDPAALHTLEKRLDEDIQNELASRKAQLEHRKQRRRRRPRRRGS